MDKGKHAWLTTDHPTSAGRQATQAVLSAARHVVAESGIRTVMLFADGLEDVEDARRLVAPGIRLILVVHKAEDAALAGKLAADPLTVPAVRLSRIDQLKMAILFAFSQGLLSVGEQFIGLVGLAGGPLDSLMLIRAGRSWEIFQSPETPPLDDVRPAVFQRVLQLAIMLAAEGREGKPVGMLLVVGDTDHVLEHADQMILNPFHGYPPQQRDILDDSLMETVREFAILDGAFVIRGDGQIVSAGVYLRPTLPGEPLPPGLGARHATAAGITASTRCLAVTISESTGTIRLWRGGRIITQIKKQQGTGGGD